MDASSREWQMLAHRLLITYSLIGGDPEHTDARLLTSIGGSFSGVLTIDQLADLPKSGR
jgi:hypothetical protein